MSRTDKHRPLWVQERDPLLHHEFRADHDHSSGPCDLAVRLADPRTPWSDTACHLNYCGHRQICGCPLCTDRWGRRAHRRRARAQHRRLGTALRKDPASADALLSRPVVKAAWQARGRTGAVAVAPPARCEVCAPWPWVKEAWQAAWPGFVAPGRTSGRQECDCGPAPR